MRNGSVTFETKRATDTRREDAEAGLAEHAYTVVRDRIVRGEYLLGQVISRRRIAAGLGISFQPAAEALLRLEHEGLLESRPRAGTRIRIPTKQVMQGHFVLREALQVQAAMMLSQCATAEERTQLFSLASCLDAERLSESRDLRERLRLHEELHRTIVACAHCELLSEEMRKQSALISAWLCTIACAIPEDAQPKHELLVKALVRRNSSAAAEAMRAHIHAETENTLRALEPSFETNKKYMQAYSRTIGGNPRKRASQVPSGIEFIGGNLPPALSTVA
jgi:DNA-binding GntR family transcriptional regulator